MGGCFSYQKYHAAEAIPSCKFHLTVYEQMEPDNMFNLKNDENENLNMFEYVLSENGYLVVRHKAVGVSTNHFFVDEFGMLNGLQKATVIGFLSEGTDYSGRLHSLVTNCSFNHKNLHFNDLWELITQKEEEYDSRGRKLQVNDSIRFGTQKLRFAFQSQGRKSGVDAERPLPGFTPFFQLKMDSQSETPYVPKKSTIGRTASRRVTTDATKCMFCLVTVNFNHFYYTLCECPDQERYVHQHCFGYYLIERSYKTSLKRGIIYMIGHLACENCGKRFTSRSIDNEHFYNHFKPELNTFHDYVIFEIYDSDFTNVVSGFAAFDLEINSEFTVGKSNKMDIVFKSETVSKSHAVITIEDQMIFLKDCGSKYGTMVNFGVDKQHKSLREITFIAGDFLIEVHPFVESECTCNLDYEEKIPYQLNPFLPHITDILEEYAAVDELNEVPVESQNLTEEIENEESEEDNENKAENDETAEKKGQGQQEEQESAANTETEEEASSQNESGKKSLSNQNIGAANQDEDLDIYSSDLRAAPSEGTNQPNQNQAPSAFA